MSGNRRHWGGKFTEKHAYRFRLSRHPAWISENDLLMYRCNMSDPYRRCWVARAIYLIDVASLMAASRLGEVRMGSRWRDLRFTDQPCCMREWQLLYRLASVRDGSVRLGGQGRKPIGRRPQLTRQEMRPMRGCRIRGIRSYTTTSAAITSLRWNCSALQCTRYHTSRICARCFGATVWQANTRRLAVVLS